MKSLWFAHCMLLSAAAAWAHVNDRGMDYRAYKDRYGQSCCDVRDCRPAADFVETFVNGQAVVRLLIDGIWIAVSRSYVVAAHASDGRVHFWVIRKKGARPPVELKRDPTSLTPPPRQT